MCQCRRTRLIRNIYYTRCRPSSLGQRGRLLAIFVPLSFSCPQQLNESLRLCSGPTIERLFILCKSVIAVKMKPMEGDDNYPLPLLSPVSSSAAADEVEKLRNSNMKLRGRGVACCGVVFTHLLIVAFALLLLFQSSPYN